jgi:hypothetical protein
MIYLMIDDVMIMVIQQLALFLVIYFASIVTT